MLKLIDFLLSIDNSKIRIKTMVSSGITSGLLGIGVSFIVNSTLAEISVSPFFSLYFGVLFMILGAVIACRVYSQSITDIRRKYFLAFGGLVLISGVICFLLEKNWFLGLGAHIKIPLYGILGISVSYALTFALVDLINYVFSFLFTYGRPIIENSEQIISVIAFSALMGAIFGVIFGVMDIEDETSYHFKLNLMKEEYYCYPIGAGIGFVCGCVNDYLKTDHAKQSDSFEDEI